MRRRLRIVLLAVVVAVALTLFPAEADATFTGITETHHQGFDTCDAQPAASYDAWKGPSPFWTTEAYIGGDTRSCDNLRLSFSWFNHLIPRGWGFFLTWVGPQSHCNGHPQGDYISNTVSTAASQGATAATNAIFTAAGLGFGPGSTMLEYDLENDSSGTSSQVTACHNAANAFISAWDDTLTDNGWYSSVYGSSCATALSDFKTIGHPPGAIRGGDAVDGDSGGSPHVYNMNCVPATFWEGNRSKQWRVSVANTITRTYGGVTISPLDLDCSDGPVSPSGRSTAVDTACQGS
jgi:hypothetical protein